MDTSSITDARTALICARLHFRGGKRLLQAGYSGEGLVALYDAVLFGMRYYIARHKRCEPWLQDTDPWDPAGLFHALARAGVFDDALTFHRFSWMVERVLWQEAVSLDAASTVAQVEKMLNRLGVTPSRYFAFPGESRMDSFVEGSKEVTLTSKLVDHPI